MRNPTWALVLTGVMLAASTCTPSSLAAQAPEGTDRGPTLTSAATAPRSDKDATVGAPELREWFGGGRPWSRWSRMTGDWGAWRTAFESRGITVDLNHVGDASGLVSGPGNAAVVGRALRTVDVGFDLGQLLKLNGTRALVQYQRKGGGHGANCLDEGQGFSNIDAENFSRIGEVWVEQQLGSRLRMKVGRIDANTEFASVENGGEFINASMGYSPTIFLLPTYPDPKAGVVIQAQPSEWFYVGAGAFNGGPAIGVGNFAAVFAIGETGLRWSKGGGGRLGVGYWRTSGTAPAIDGSDGGLTAQGQFAVFDQLLWSSGHGGETRSIAAFAQAGFSNPRVSSIARHVGAGLTATGVIPGRSRDAVGIGVSSVAFGDDVPCARTATGEMNVGGFYKLALSGWLALKPDIQIVRYPAGDRSRTVTVGTLRVEVGF